MYLYRVFMVASVWTVCCCAFCATHGNWCNCIFLVKLVVLNTIFTTFRDISGVELLMNNHQGLKAEIDARDENFTICVNLGKDLLMRKHQRSPEASHFSHFLNYFLERMKICIVSKGYWEFRNLGMLNNI